MSNPISNQSPSLSQSTANLPLLALYRTPMPPDNATASIGFASRLETVTSQEMAALNQQQPTVPVQASVTDNLAAKQTRQRPSSAALEIHRDQKAAPKVADQGGTPQEKEVEMTLEDFVDIVNPLQHIPLFSTLYREITGDEISAHAQIAGDFVYGGLLGGFSSVFNMMAKDISGKDLGEHMMAAFSGEKRENADPDPSLALAHNSPQKLERPSAADLVAFLPQAAPKAASPQVATGQDSPEKGSDFHYEGQDALAALYRDLNAKPTGKTHQESGVTTLDALAKSGTSSLAAFSPAHQARRWFSLREEVGNRFAKGIITQGPSHGGVNSAAYNPAAEESLQAYEKASKMIDKVNRDQDITNKILQSLDKYEAMKASGLVDATGKL